MAREEHRKPGHDDPILFSDLRDLELDERTRLSDRQLTLESVRNSKRPLTDDEKNELDEIAKKLQDDDIVDPLFKAVQNNIVSDVGHPLVADHKGGLLPSQQTIEFFHEWFAPRKRGGKNQRGLGGALHIIELAGLATYPNKQPLAISLLDLWNSDARDTIQRALVVVVEAFDVYVRAAKDPANAGPARDALIASIDAALGNPADNFAARLKEVIAAGFVSGAECLTDWLAGGLSPTYSRRNKFPSGELRPEEIKFAAVYGLLEADDVRPPTFHLVGVVPPYDPSNVLRKQQFGKAVYNAIGEYTPNADLFKAVLKILIQLGNQGPFDVVDAREWALVVRKLIARGVTADESQLGRKVDDALNSIQNIGDELAPSDTGIDLPLVDGATTILMNNIIALQPAYFALMFDEMGAFQVVDKCVEQFQNGTLPIGRGTAGDALFKYWKETAIRVSENERRSFYARTLGSVTGHDDAPNREFNDLFLRFVSSVSWFVRQNNVDDLLRTKIPGAVSQQQVRKSARDLAANLSLHGFGMAYFMATDLQKQVKEVIAILSHPEIMAAYGARDMWQVIDQVAATELDGAKNSLRYRSMAASGAIIIAWLANNAEELSAGNFDPILDIDEIRNPPPRRNGSKPTTDPNDADLVNACEQWLAATGTQEDTVENYSQRKESPMMTSKPIQIPSIAKEMLDAAGVPAFGLGNGVGARRSRF